ncbi:hypothetical protein [Haloarchaeobius sp. HME9146]|uniref:hypothetical protein n=1 Tax=Haloarchaeobius sp. HME9146 TaxID=2978732 RepID=UPI0021BFB63A|nr:hypothetical protein [Haloarchaeobius sp. HME9146]MCT9097756.1 hypothetical protein [Haloarchaeobius sp. HME9146]
MSAPTARPATGLYRETEPVGLEYTLIMGGVATVVVFLALYLNWAGWWNANTR